MVEHLSSEQKVAGSSPVLSIDFALQLPLSFFTSFCAYDVNPMFLEIEIPKLNASSVERNKSWDKAKCIQE